MSSKARLRRYPGATHGDITRSVQAAWAVLAPAGRNPESYPVTLLMKMAIISWAHVGVAAGSRLARRRPILIVQSDSCSASRLSTIVGLVVSSNTSLAALPGNVFLPATATGLPKDSVVNVIAILTLDKTDLGDPVVVLPRSLTDDVDRGLRAATSCSPRSAPRSPGSSASRG